MGHPLTPEGPGDERHHGHDGAAPVDVDNPRISLPCKQGKHPHCRGRVTLARIDRRTGNRWAICECPVCKHEPDARLLTGAARRARGFGGHQ